jgi:hypothetical protein
VSRGLFRISPVQKPAGFGNGLSDSGSARKEPEEVLEFARRFV